ncbi:MAG: MBL fold metallo-hydrolase [Clostridia bacterium]|nr:MBL fold metallo-hydrolase [Clostridia bacterium]
MMKLKHIICSVIVGTLLLGTCACSSKKAKTTLTYIGHASVKIVASDGTVLYIDPNYQGDYSQNADYIIVTHKHDDHMPNATLKLNDNGQKFDNSDFLHDGIYETMNLGPFTVEAVPAGGNPNHDVKYCVGYLVTVDGVTIYHAGDTSMIEQMADLKSRNIDYAMYPIDGVFNMDAVEATEVANLVGAKNNIPIHEFDQNGSKKSDNFTPDGRMVLEYGETITIAE